MTKEKEKDKKVAKEQLLLEASRLGQLEQLEIVLSQLQQLKSRKKTNPLASLRKSVGPNSIRDPVTGFTCLHHAALNGHGQCVQLILDYGAKLNALDYKGSSPLHLAAWAGNLEVVRILLSRRQPASPNELLATQQSPGNNNHHHNKQQRVDLNLCNNDNQTPLSLAAQFGHHQVVAELLASGANVHLRNNRLESPLELACLNGRLETVELLLDSSAALVADLRRPRASLPLAQHQVDGITTQQVDSRPASISGSDLWSSPAAQPGGGHARRPSGSGWTSFLRGRRDSTGGSSVPATSGGNNQSPLHRLTSGTLSMRGQKSPASQQASLDQQVELAAAATSAEGRCDLQRRRATLTVGTTLSARELAKQMSLELDRTSEQVQSGVSSSLVSEKLLDHSPLHYATRKGHVNVVNLLLYKYQANILQVTSMGSVLHEIALNNGKNSEMIGLFFNFIAEQQQQQQQQQQQKQPNAAQVDSNRLQQLNSFLCLLNEQQRSVFEVLNEINNRSAQEIKRLIYEYSDQIQQQQQQQQQQIARPQTIPTTPAAANLLEIEQQQQQVQVQQRLNTQPACDYSSQELRESQQQPQAQQAMRFSDIHHFNSFVTMKRVPKNQQQQQQQLLTGAGSAGQQRQVNQVAQLQVGSTQTVDRRASVRRHDFQQQQQASCEQQSRQPTNFQQVSYQSAFGANNAHLPGIEQSAISRSVSNLSRASIKQYSNDSQSQNDPTHLMWQQWLARGNNYLPQQQQHDHHHRQAQQLSNGTYLSSGNATRNHYEQQHQQDSSGSRGRSKSRDLGSLLIEAHQLEATQQPPDQHHLYDNNAQVSRTSAGVVEAPHLVRSQTDCSHLMGRFFGDQKSAAYLSSGDRQQQQQVDDQQQQPSNANSERRMINRHYHVYDHQFYPPRLLPTTTAANQREQKPTVGNLLRNESGQLRSSVRSTASSQSSNRYQHLISQRQQQHQQLHQRQPASDLLSSSSSLSQQPLRNNSRLSLNIDPQTARQADGLTCEQQQQHQSSSQQANNMDRFLARHSRKVQQEQQVAGAQQVVSAEQKRQALVELQRRLLAESLGQQHQQQLQQHIHSSYSLESHLSEPHLFESTRRALMKDFDKMIGQELLNRNHRPIIDGGLQQAAAGTRSVNGTTTDSCRLPTAQQPSILTGVMLDMDRYGERLTVSGTRVTRKSSSADISRSHPRNLSTNGTLKSTQNSDEDTNSNSGGSSSNNSNSSVSRPPPPVASPGSSLSTSSAPLTSYATSREPPPPKPPRPSLLTRANTSQQQHQRPGIIYDLPATAPTSSTDVRAVNHLDQTSRTSSGRQVFSRSQTLNQTVVAQVAPVATKLSRVSHTEPPKVRPPPPPASKALTSPLHVLPPNLSEVASTGAASSSNSSTGSGEIGLLKMAAAATSSIGARSPGQRRAPPPPPNNLALTLNSSTQLTDPDSGVCTSNSPASLSHDSESGGIAAPGSCEPEVTASSVISKRTRSNDESVHQQQLDCIMPASATEVANHHVDSPARAPPSPKTAQLCIEEALLPLAMVHKTATEQTTSPLLTSGSARQSANAVDRWLVTDNPLQQQQQLTLEKPPEADYENCRSLQEQLQHASCKTVGQLLTAEVSPMDSLDRVDCCDDADYAESSSDNNSALSSSELSRGSVDELSNGGRAPEHHQQQAVSPDKVAAVTEILDGKEVLLKVVIDKSEKAANGDEVFYINPLELKRLAAKQSQHQLDSGTLTDEELCAAIDKNSGYIRFTLRKRRNNGSGDEQNLPTVSDKSLMIVDGEQEQPVASSCSKRTKFNSNHEQQVETKEVSCGADQDQAGVKSVINANVCADLSPTATTTSTKDRQEIDSSAILRQIHKQGALRLSQWFTTNLTGLAEYQTAFLHNGLDNMQFLNHKKILNDETLKQIGIDNESHRLLIVERVSKELPQANFEHILSSLSPKAGKVSLVKVLEFLQLEHLSNNDQSVFAKDEQLHLDCLNSVRDKLVNLPLGHRLRLSAALDFLEAEKLKANETEQQGAAGEQQQPPPPLCKQVSSESSEVEMEASQASATSSSSSKESIKSMVLMKMDHQSNDSEGEQQQPLQQVTKEDVKMPTMTINRLTDENKENNKSEDMINRVKKTVSPPMQVDRRQPFSVSAAAKTAGRSCSLVSEAARKLEAAAAAASINQKNQPAKSGPPPPKPVAAVRKINNNRLADCSSRDSSSDSLQQQPVAAAVNPTSKVSKSTTTKTTATNGVVEGKVSSLNSSKRSSPKTTATHFVPVKSICWPPKSTQQESRQSTCEIAPTVNKLQSVKSTYQKLLDEKSKSDYNNGGSTDDQQTQQQQQQVVAAVAGKLKPKPAPPAKPAKLAASKFNVDFSHKL